MTAPLRWILYPLAFIAGSAVIGAALLGIFVVLAYPQLPALGVLTDYQPKVPLRVYTEDGYLIGEFGAERRALVRIQDVPVLMKEAILSAEDERFYEHPGVDTLGVLRAAYANFISHDKKEGASTITMQVARNFFLSSEKTMTRKAYEALLAFKIEHNLTKDQILQIYINQIYLGEHAYGFAAAAQTYFGKPLKDLSLAQTAVLAGLPKGPSAYNPIANPKRAKLRQLYVLRRMRAHGYITEKQLEQAKAEPLHVTHDANSYPVEADYVAEMARRMVVELFPDDAYSKGLRVITTIDKADQEEARAALRKGVLDYDRRHGYRGAEGYVDLSKPGADQDEALEDALQDVPDSDDIVAAVVLHATPRLVKAYRRGGEIVEISGEGLRFAREMLGSKAPPNKRLRRGAIIHVQQDDRGRWQIAQLPEVEAALVSGSPLDGHVRALVGGFDFYRNKFNHVTQAWRQPGSSFKPFIYSAALEKGYTPASILPDEPLVIPASETGSQDWEPRNYDGKYDGPMSLRTALAESKNLVSIRLLRSIGTHYAQDYITRFGFDADKHPPYLTMALGAGSVTPWQMFGAYSIFANGGYRVNPYVVKEILDGSGNVIARAQPEIAGDESNRVIDPRNAFIIDSMLHDVVRRGTGVRALVLKRGDLAGKTGTTNDFVDAWFCGYQPTLVTITWIGFDQPRKLGNGETGAHAALPIWIDYMRQALKGVPESYMAQPPGLVRISVSDPSSKVPGATTQDYMYKEDLPPVPQTPQASPVAPDFPQPSASAPGLPPADGAVQPN